MTSSSIAPQSALLDKVAHDLCKMLASRCRFSFDADPNTEVGKVHPCPIEPGAWVFFVYVMLDVSPRQRVALRCNVIRCSPAGVEVSGPDEKAIAMVLKEPVL
jgi:hypothetical protein